MFSVHRTIVLNILQNLMLQNNVRGGLLVSTLMCFTFASIYRFAPIIFFQLFPYLFYVSLLLLFFFINITQTSTTMQNNIYVKENI